MKNKLISLLIIMLMIAIPLSSVASAGSEQNPEIKDVPMDVKLFGFFSGLPQYLFKQIDIVSAWFTEENNEPDYLFISLKVRDLKDTSDPFEALYSVTWIYNDEPYQTLLKIHSDGIYNGYNIIDPNNHLHSCEGIFDIEASIITWKIPKDKIGDPPIGSQLISTSAYALLRPFDESTGKVGADFFKDLTLELIPLFYGRYGANYRVRF
jgi:hypothetical protein